MSDVLAVKLLHQNQPTFPQPGDCVSWLKADRLMTWFRPGQADSAVQVAFDDEVTPQKKALTPFCDEEAFKAFVTKIATAHLLPLTQLMPYNSTRVMYQFSPW